MRVRRMERAVRRRLILRISREMFVTGGRKGGWKIDCLLSQSHGSGLLLLDEDPENLDRLFS